MSITFVSSKIRRQSFFTDNRSSKQIIYEPTDREKVHASYHY